MGEEKNGEPYGSVLDLQGCETYNWIKMPNFNQIFISSQLLCDIGPLLPFLVDLAQGFFWGLIDGFEEASESSLELCSFRHFLLGQ